MGKSIYFDSIDFDAGIRAYPSAGTASCAFVGIRHVCIMISTVVHLIGLKRQRLCGTSHNAEIATLASFDVDGNCAFYFCHVGCVIMV